MSEAFLNGEPMMPRGPMMLCVEYCPTKTASPLMNQKLIHFLGSPELQGLPNITPAKNYLARKVLHPKSSTFEATNQKIGNPAFTLHRSTARIDRWGVAASTLCDTGATLRGGRATAKDLNE